MCARYPLFLRSRNRCARIRVGAALQSGSPQTACSARLSAVRVAEDLPDASPGHAAVRGAGEADAEVHAGAAKRTADRAEAVILGMIEQD